MILHKPLQNALSLVIFMALTPAHASVDNLPDLGAPDLVTYDQQTEEKLGYAFSTALHQNFTLNYDPEVVSYIRKIGHQIASQTGNHRNFQFYVVQNDSINAFAGPNGIIGIHTGLIQAVKSEDELASVIAHEIAHVTQNHLSRRYEYNATEGTATSIATFIAALLIGMHDTNAGMATLMGGMGLNLEKQLKNSRQHESEADAIGITLLHKTGYDPHAMSQFFAKLSQESRNNTFSLPEILRSHPVSDHRLAEAENRAENLSERPDRKKTDHLALIKARLIPPKEALFEAHLTDNILCYQKTLRALSKANVDYALIENNCLYNIVTEHPEHPLYSLLFIEQNAKTRINIPQALNIAEYQQALHPTDMATLMRHADLLLSQNTPLLAASLIETYASQLPYQYLPYKKLAETYQSLHRLPDAYFARAIAAFSIGNHARAEYLLSQAEK
ncbi:MAG: M48 family metalloprotease, partial [Gammaproteobacteria bacterium]|nr:M48 family metalloprotease [Gammaproteobacteria bacterium]